MRHALQRERVVLDPEVQRARALAAQIGDQRVIGVEHELARLQVGRPAVGDRLELAVAVELVAEQVAKQDRARVQLRGERVEPQLVDLEQSKLALDRAVRTSRAQERGGDPSGHVRALGVVHEREASVLEDAGSHRGGRRLAVRGRDQRAASTKASAELADRIAVEPDQDLAGRARRATAAHPRQPCDGARERKLRRQRRRHPRGALPKAASALPSRGTITLTAPAIARTRSGSSPIGSPSAYISNERSASI